MTRFVFETRGAIAGPFARAFALVVAAPLSVLHAQDPQIRIRTLEAPRAMALAMADANRPVLGVALSTGTRADTAGLEILDVTPDGPAAKAGLAVGARIEAINGVSLRISADDAADPLTADAGHRRLQRELGKAKAGDAVELRVREGTRVRTVTVTTVSAADLTRAQVAAVSPRLRGVRESLEQRAALGLGLGSAGNARDTLGVFVTSVTGAGPADQAGIVEGERIASINGVDVRVPREDAEDPGARQARVARLLREVEKAAPGDRIALRVYGGGRYRDVTVTAGKASEFGGGGYRFEFRTGPEGAATIVGPGWMMRQEAPMAPRAPTAPRPARVP
jgi:predicted metalloprotease with PDZ domain